MNNSDPSVILGPLLGYENNGIYTVCVLVDQSYTTLCCEFINQNNNYHRVKKCSSPIIVRDNYYYRFEFEIPEWNNCTVSYRIKTDSGVDLVTRHGKKEWEFRVSDQNEQPEIAFISCAGMHSKYPIDIKPKFFLGWEHLLDYKPHFMILSGDQVYADSIFKKVKYLKLSIERDETLYNEEQIDRFYFNLYIDSWSNKHMAQALAEIPNIMTWDDHDIIDGYGSYEEFYYDRLKVFYLHASKYFELFQIRTKANKSLINISKNVKKKDYTQIVTLGTNLYVLPDTRTFRQWKRILHRNQYDAINYKLLEISKNLETIDLLAFVLPVPIAHRDFTSKFEKLTSKLLDKILGFNMLTDDLIDHWDHEYHKPEQKIMMDFIFSWAAQLRSKYVIIVSGDVHSSGAVTITQTLNHNELRFATQVVSSPMVNNSSSIRNKIDDFISYDFKTFDNYSCHLLRFGTYPYKDIYARNFIILKKEMNMARRLYLHFETRSGWTDKYKGERISRNLKARIDPT